MLPQEAYTPGTAKAEDPYMGERSSTSGCCLLTLLLQLSFVTFTNHHWTTAWHHFQENSHFGKAVMTVLLGITRNSIIKLVIPREVWHLQSPHKLTSHIPRQYFSHLPASCFSALPTLCQTLPQQNFSPEYTMLIQAEHQIESCCHEQHRTSLCRLPTTLQVAAQQKKKKGQLRSIWELFNKTGSIFKTPTKTCSWFRLILICEA